MKVSVKKTYNILLCMLFIQMLILPKTYMLLKMLFLVGVVVLCIYMLGFRIKLNTGAKIIVAYVVWNIISIMNGAIHGYVLEALRLGTVGVLWPLVYVVLAGKRFDSEQLRSICKCLVAITLFLSMTDIALVVSYFIGNDLVVNILSAVNLHPVLVSLSEGYVEFRIDHLYFYAFLVPFIVTLFFGVGAEKMKLENISERILSIVTFLAVMAAILTGMGGIWLASTIGVVLSFSKYGLKLRRQYILPFVFVVLICAGIAVISLLHQGFAYNISQEVLYKFGFESTIDIVDTTRSDQMTAALETWLNNPIIGQGKATPISYYRDGGIYNINENELSYAVILYGDGLIGFCAFFAVVCYSIYILSKRKDINWFTEPFRVGLVCYLVANAFNPYLTNFSNMWILYLPYMIGYEQVGMKLTS